MKSQYEYVHDNKNSKIWTIEQKGKNIKILFGKKNSTMNETLLSFLTEKEAKDNYKKEF
jgi:predicted DNA-binding WGR domain protein